MAFKLPTNIQQGIMQGASGPSPADRIKAFMGNPAKVDAFATQASQLGYTPADIMKTPDFSKMPAVQGPAGMNMAPFQGMAPQQLGPSQLMGAGPQFNLGKGWAAPFVTHNMSPQQIQALGPDMLKKLGIKQIGFGGATSAPVPTQQQLGAMAMGQGTPGLGAVLQPQAPQPVAAPTTLNPMIQQAPTSIGGWLGGM